MKNMAELDNRTQPDLFDAFRTLSDMNISIEELSEYAEQFDSKALITDPVPLFPQPSETRLNHLKPGSREVLHRYYYTVWKLRKFTVTLFWQKFRKSNVFSLLKKLLNS